MEKIITILLIISLSLASAASATTSKEPEPVIEKQTIEAEIEGTEEDDVAKSEGEKPVPAAEAVEETVAVEEPEEETAVDFSVIENEDELFLGEETAVAEEASPKPVPWKITIDGSNFFDYFNLVETRSYEMDPSGTSYSADLTVSVRLKEGCSLANGFLGMNYLKIVYSYANVTDQFYVDYQFGLMDPDIVKPPEGAIHDSVPFEDVSILFPLETDLYSTHSVYQFDVGYVSLNRITNIEFKSISGTLYLNIDKE